MKLSLAILALVVSGCASFNTPDGQIDLNGTANNAAILIPTGPAPGPSPSPSALVLPVTAPGSSQDATLTLYNEGVSTAADLGIAAGTSLPAEIAFKGGTFPGTGGTCAQSITSGESCTLVLTYPPVVSGVTSGKLPFAYFNGIVTFPFDIPYSVGP